MWDFISLVPNTVTGIVTTTAKHSVNIGLKKKRKGGRKEGREGERILLLLE